MVVGLTVEHKGPTFAHATLFLLWSLFPNPNPHLRSGMACYSTALHPTTAATPLNQSADGMRARASSLCGLALLGAMTGRNSHESHRQTPLHMGACSSVADTVASLLLKSCVWGGSLSQTFVLIEILSKQTNQHTHAHKYTYRYTQTHTPLNPAYTHTHTSQSCTHTHTHIP